MGMGVLAGARLSLVLLATLLLPIPAVPSPSGRPDDHDTHAFLQDVARHEARALALVEAWPDVCGITHTGVNALHVAVFNGNAAVVRACLGGGGVDPLVKDGRGKANNVPIKH